MYVGETLVSPLKKLAAAMQDAFDDEERSGLESSHALAQTIKEAKRLHDPSPVTTTRPDFLVCLSGRGDKDLQHVAGFIR
ncbi:MAG: hypothetical protein FWH27_12680 [Planctomycetaceae bacterium]|nr:hypothetical protein [Planctomycetaceae bacterium]